VFARGCDERFEVSIQDEWYRKHVLNVAEFQTSVTYFGILVTLGGMLTAFWKMILETVFIRKGVKAARTNEALCFVT